MSMPMARTTSPSSWSWSCDSGAAAGACHVSWLLGAAVVAVLLYAIVIYNLLVRDRNRVATAWSDIDVQLKRRHDLLPKLVEAVRRYAAYEQATLESVTELRTRSEQASAVPEIGALETALAVCAGGGIPGPEGGCGFSGPAAQRERSRAAPAVRATLLQWGGARAEHENRLLSGSGFWCDDAGFHYRMPILYPTISGGQIDSLVSVAIRFGSPTGSVPSSCYPV